LKEKCEGKELNWSHIVDLYMRNGGATISLFANQESMHNRHGEI
jgi:hypothetical protein